MWSSSNPMAAVLSKGDLRREERWHAVQFFSNLTQTRVTQEVGPSLGELPPSDRLVVISMGHFINN